jgi:hypothetical protein
MISGASHNIDIILIDGAMKNKINLNNITGSRYRWRAFIKEDQEKLFPKYRVYDIL